MPNGAGDFVGGRDGRERSPLRRSALTTAFQSPEGSRVGSPGGTPARESLPLVLSEERVRSLTQEAAAMLEQNITAASAASFSTIVTRCGDEINEGVRIVKQDIHLFKETNDEMCN